MWEEGGEDAMAAESLMREKKKKFTHQHAGLFNVHHILLFLF